MSKAFLLVEGHGEVGAAENLVTRLAPSLVWGPARRWLNLHREQDFKKGAEYVRRTSDASALLVLRDEDDGCPRDLGPRAAGWLAELALPFPAAVVLLKPEYEVLFLPCIERMAGKALKSGPLPRPGLGAHARWEHPGDWERRRGVKEWLTSQFPSGRSYKPTTDQLAMTRMIDFDQLRGARVPCFGTLENGLRFLAENIGRAGRVYPPLPSGRSEL